MQLSPAAAMDGIFVAIWFQVLMKVVFELVTINDWLSRWCDAGRDAWIYSLSSPP